MELDLVTQGEGGVGCLSDSPDVFGNAHCMRTKSDESLPTVTEWRPPARRSRQRQFGCIRVTQGPLDAPIIHGLNVAPACAQRLASNSAKEHNDSGQRSLAFFDQLGALSDWGQSMGGAAPGNNDHHAR